MGYTVDFCTGGTATSSVFFSHYDASKAFDDNVSTFADLFPCVYPEWVKYDLGSGITKIAAQYTIARSGTGGYFTNWKFQGSNDNINWTDIDTQSGQVFSVSETKTYNSFSNSTGYRYYRWLASAGCTNDIAISELEIMGFSGLYYETIEDTINLSDSSSSSLQCTAIVEDSFDAKDVFPENYAETIEDTLNNDDQIGIIWPTSLSDDLTLGDDPLVGWYMTASDEIDLSEDIFIPFVLLVSSNLFSYDNAYVGWGLSAVSGLSLADTVDAILGLIITEWLTLIDTEADNWNGREIVDDTFEGYDESLAYKIFSDTLSDAVDLADSPTYQLIIEVLEYLWFNDLAEAAMTFAQSVADTVNLADGAERAFPLSVESLLSAIDLSTVSGMFLNQIAESIDFADVSDAVNRIGVSVTDPLVFAETITNQGEFYTAVYDTLQLNTLVELAGDVYECYVLNTPKFFPSMYSGFDFNSYAVFENRAFGANDTGIFELTGDNDAGSTIHTGVIMPNTDFGAPNQKRFRRGYFGITGTTPLMILETEHGERQAYSIEMVKGKAVSSHELKSKKWVLSVADFESLDNIKLIPVILTK